MNKDRAIKRILQILGFRTDLATEAGEALEEAQEDAENGMLGFLPWFLKRIKVFGPDELRTEEINENVSRNWLQLPDRFLREYDPIKGSLFVANVGPLIRVGHLAPDGSGGFYDQVANYYIDPFPRPPDFPARIVFNRYFVDGFRAEYVYYARENSDAGENNWYVNGSQFLIGQAGLKMSGVNNKHAVQIFEDMRKTGADILIRQNTAYETSSMRPDMGSDYEKVLYNQSDYDGQVGFLTNDRDLGDRG